MSIASDLRSYADSAVAQSRQVIDQTVSTAQAQLNDVSDQANGLVENFTATARENFSDIADKANGVASDFADKAGDVAADLRVQAEKVVNLDAIKSAIEPYLAQAKGYGAQVTDRAEVLIDNLRNDKRFAKFIDSAESVSGVVIETVQERVVAPVQNLTGFGSKSTASKPSPAKSRPAAKKPAARKPAATKPAATKPATARKAAPRKAAPKA